jgi:hypothetical protein
MKATPLFILAFLLQSCASVPDIPNASTSDHPGPLAQLYAKAHPEPERWNDPAKLECRDRTESLVTEIAIERSSCLSPIT